MDYTEWTEPYIMTFEEKMESMDKGHLLQWIITKDLRRISDETTFIAVYTGRTL